VLANNPVTIQSSGGGILTITGAITGNQNLTLQNNSATTGGVTLAAVNTAGLITNSGTGNGSVIITGVISTSITGVTQNSATSQLTLSGTANTFTAPLTISQGTLSAAGVGSVGSATGSIVLGDTSTKGTLVYTGANGTIGRNFTINSGGGEVDSTTNTLTLSKPISLGTGPLTFGGAGSISMATAAVVPFSGSNALTKNGAGTLTITTTTQATPVTLDAMPINLNQGTISIVMPNFVTVNPLGTGAITLTPNQTTAPLFTIGQNGQIGNTYANSINVNNVAGTVIFRNTSGAIPISGPVTFASGAATPTLQLASTSGTTNGVMNFSGGFSGPGNIQFNASSSTNSAITLSGAMVNNSGTITNIGTIGSTMTISATIGSNVTNVAQQGTSIFTITSLFATNVINQLVSTGSGAWNLNGGISGTDVTMNANSTGNITIGGGATGLSNFTGTVINNNGTGTGAGVIAANLPPTITPVTK